jgi:splicing factor 3B subunit 3
MHLFHLTLSPAGAVSHGLVGSFSGSAKVQEILTTSGTSLQVLRPDASSGRLLPLVSSPVFGIVRSLAAFRLPGSSLGALHQLGLSTRLINGQTSLPLDPTLGG